MAVNAQQIKQFNQKNQAVAQVAPPANNPPAQGTPPTNNPPAQAAPGQGNQPPKQIKLHSKMSASDIALLTKDQATLTKEEAIRRKALETKETLREKEEAEEAQRQAQIEADRRQGRIDRVATSQVLHGLKSLDKATMGQRAWIMRAPTVGGIGALLAIIIIFLLAVLPVDKQGNTRLFLIWLTLTGKASVKLPPGTLPGTNADVTSNSTITLTNSPSPDIVTAAPPVVEQSPVSFTLPAVFQNGSANLLDSLFG